MTRSAFKKVLFGKGNDHEGKEITVETSPFVSEINVQGGDLVVARPRAKRNTLPCSSRLLLGLMETFGARAC